MRVLHAVILIALCIAGVNAAHATDLPSGAAENYTTRGIAHGHRTGSIVVYDYQPGVVVRAYWRAPWRHRHYYPTTGIKPEVGRDEDLSATSSAPEPAETFYRSWSTSSAFLPEAPRASARDIDAPRTPQSPQAPGAVKP